MPEPAHIEFDHHSREYADHTWEIYADVRARCPVAHSASHDGFWLVSSYEQVFEAARDDATYASAHVPGDPMKRGISVPDREFVSIPIELDPPEFRPYRSMLNPYFSPKATAYWLEVIQKWTTVCLDHVIEKGEFDIVLDLANPVPALFTSELLGLPLEDWRKYAEPMHTQIYSVPGSPEMAAALEGMQWIVASLHRIVAERRADPQDDMISKLVAEQVNGAPMDDETIVNIAFLIIAGGFDTTTAMMANMLWYLDENREARRLLIEEPDRIKPAIEEFLRYFTPTQALGRTVTRDVELGGQQLHRGDRVLLSWAAANHDPEAFDRPDEIVLDRSPNRHVTFGIGQHRCLGSNFARAELALMLGEVLRRIPDYEIVREGAQRYPSIGIVNGWVQMPARFTPGARTAHDHLPGFDVPAA